MMNMNKKNIDPLAEVKKHPKFKRFSEESEIRIKLATEIYEMRINKSLSQQELAKMAETTQKVVSRIESGNVNLGIDLLQRIARRLDFTIYNWTNIFDKKHELQQVSYTIKIPVVVGWHTTQGLEMQPEIKSEKSDNKSIKITELPNSLAFAV